MRSNLPGQRNRWTETVSTIIMSILLALIVWIFAIDQENPLVRQEFPEPIPVNVRGLAEGLQTLQDLSKKTVTLTLRAPRRSWENLDASDFNAYIDLSGLGPGTYDVEVQVDVVNPDVDVINTQSRQFRVQIEPVVSKTVPVQVEVMDSPAFGYEWQQPIAEPNEVQVSGPSTQVDQVMSAVAEVFLRNAKTQVERVQPVSPRNSQNQTVERITVDPLTVRIVVPVVQRPGQKEVAVLVPIEGQPAPNYHMTSVKIEPATVMLLGSPESLSGVGYVETNAISIEGATSDVRERLPLILPENVSVLNDASISVLVSIAPIESSITVTRHPIVQGLANNMRASVSLDKVDVIISGSLPRLDAISPEDVQVMLDLTGLLPGSHVVQPNVVAPEGIQVEGVLPQAVEVVIEALATPTPTITPTPGESQIPQNGEGPPSATATPTPASDGNGTIPAPTDTPSANSQSRQVPIETAELLSASAKTLTKPEGSPVSASVTTLTGTETLSKTIEGETTESGLRVPVK